MLNNICMIGRMTGNPELRHTQSNTSVCSFTLAVNRDFDRDKTDFIDCIAWGKTAEFVCNYFTKGMQVAVSGRLETRNWEDKQGAKRKSVEVIAENVYFADSKKTESQDKPDFEEIDDDGQLPF